MVTWCKMITCTFEVVVGRTREDRENMKKLFTEVERRECGHSVYLGYTDLATEGHWVDWQTGHQLPGNMTQK